MSRTEGFKVKVVGIESMDKREFVMFLVYLNHLIYPILKDTLRLEETADMFRNLIKAMIYSVSAVKELAELAGRSVKDVRENLESSVPLAMASLAKKYNMVLGEILKISESPKDLITMIIPMLYDIIEDNVRRGYPNYASEAKEILEAISWMTGVIWRFLSYVYEKTGEEVIKMPGFTIFYYEMLSKRFEKEPWRTWSIQWAKDLL
jgi:hypothetical protein